MKVRAELQRQLLSETMLPSAAHLVLLALVIALIRPTLTVGTYVPWAAAIVSVIVVRGVLWTALARRAELAPGTMRIVRGTMIALGLAWGVGAALLVDNLPTSQTALILLGLAGLLSGGLSTLVADEWTYPLYAIAMFLPILIGIVVAGRDRLEDIGVLLIAVFIVFTIRLHMRAHETLVQRVRVEADLRDRERQLASAQAIAHVGSWEWDIPSNVTIWSDELRRMYGVGADAPTGYGAFLERVHPDDRKGLETFMGNALATGTAVDYEWRCVRPDGTVRNILGRHVVMKDSSGQVVRMTGTSLDITERKQAEENQRTLLRELQTSIAEVKVLHGILPICASCKRIRGDGGSWEAVESYVREHTNAEFTHGLCPDCAARDWGGARS
jgi:PAS domain S-box-containing protein